MQLREIVIRLYGPEAIARLQKRDWGIVEPSLDTEFSNATRTDLQVVMYALGLIGKTDDIAAEWHRESLKSPRSWGR